MPRPAFVEEWGVGSVVVTMGHTFEDVLDAAKLGADWAWAVLYAEVSGPVMGLLRCRGAADPESAAGDVFFELARVIDDFEGSEEAFRTLVFQLAHQRLMTERSYPQSHARSYLADRVLDRLRRDVEGMDTLDQPEVPETIRAAFEVLNPEQRDVLAMRMVAGLSLEQTAEVVGRRVADVKALQRRGLARVRTTLSAEVASA